MKVKVKMLEGTYFEGSNYVRGRTYVMEEKDAKALGPSVEVVSKMKNEAPEDKMVGKAPIKK